MLRVILAAAALAMLGTPAFADAKCRTIEDVISGIEAMLPSVKHEVFIGDTSETIKTAIMKMTTETITGEHTFVVFSRPDRDLVLIVGFNGKCKDGQVTIPRKELDTWLTKDAG